VKSVSKESSLCGNTGRIIKISETSLFGVDARLPVTLVLSMRTRPPATRKSPPPTPVPADPGAPGDCERFHRERPRGYRRRRALRCPRARRSGPSPSLPG
jgi:hypothetical protein